MKKNQFDNIRSLLLTYIEHSLEEGEDSDGQTMYWIDALQAFCKAEKMIKNIDSDFLTLSD